MIQGCGSGADAAALPWPRTKQAWRRLRALRGGLGAGGGSESREGQEKDKAIHGEKYLRLDYHMRVYQASGEVCARQPINIAASSAVRGARCSTRTDSWRACAPSPTAPMPSSVGMPRAAVKLPSEPPPVEASSSAKPSSRGQRLGLAEEADGAAAALHGRTVDAAGDGERAARVVRFESGEFALDARAVGGAGDADVHFGPGMGGNDVGFCAAAGDADADGEAALEIGPAADFLDDAGEFADGVCAFFKVDAGVSGDARDVNAPIADALARRFVGEALRGLEDVDGGTLFGDGFDDGPPGSGCRFLRRR